MFFLGLGICCILVGSRHFAVLNIVEQLLSVLATCFDKDFMMSISFRSFLYIIKYQWWFWSGLLLLKLQTSSINFLSSTGFQPLSIFLHLVQEYQICQIRKQKSPHSSPFLKPIALVRPPWRKKARNNNRPLRRTIKNHQISKPVQSFGNKRWKQTRRWTQQWDIGPW